MTNPIRTPEGEESVTRGPACAVSRRIGRLTALSCLLFHSILWTFAQTPAQGAELLDQPDKPLELTAADAEAFIDGLLPVQIERDDIAGAVVVIVKDGQVLLSKGYGFADAEKRIPVNPDETLFRPGSVSKLFIWTSVMQLVEQGKLDLDADVNQYLDFSIPEAFGKPITLRNIMTHTPGFEETIKDLFVDSPQHLTPLRDYLTLHLPRRIFPPGEVPAYSNYATSLAGYIVQRVSDKPYAEYIEENIFGPLGMVHASFRQPLPEALAPSMSQGYLLASSGAKGFEWIEASPAGALSASGGDMARFMLAHLGDGAFGDARILESETAQTMHSRQSGRHESMNGFALGFYEESRNGLRIIGHGGDTLYFHSALHLIPEKGIGLFVSFNSAGRDGSPRQPLWEKFLDRYFPFDIDQHGDINSAADAQVIAGSYLPSRRNESAFFYAAAVIGQVKAIPKPDGMLVLDGINGTDGQPTQWVRTGPLAYREEHGQQHILFQRTPDGEVTLLMSAVPMIVFQKSAVYEGRSLAMILAASSLGVFASALVLWPVVALVRRHYRERLRWAASEKRLHSWVRIVFAFNLFFAAGLALTVSRGLQDIGKLNSGLDTWLRLLQVIGWLGLAGTIVVLYAAFRSWKSWEQRWGAKLGATICAAAALAWVWFVYVSNVLAFSLKY